MTSRFVKLLDGITTRHRFPVTAFAVLLLLWAVLFMLIAVSVGHIRPVESHLWALIAIAMNKVTSIGKKSDAKD